MDRYSGRSPAELAPRLRSSSLLTKWIRYRISANRFRRHLPLMGDYKSPEHPEALAGNQASQRRDRHMPNVLQFRNADNGLGDFLGDFGHGGRPSVFSAAAHSSAQIARIRALQAQAKKDIGAAILLLDIALVHGRLVSLKVDDQEISRRMDEGLRVVEELLAIARARTANL